MSSPSDDRNAAVAAVLKVPRLVHLALMACVPVYGFVVHVLAAEVEVEGEPDRMVLATIALLAAVIVGVALPFLRRRLLPVRMRARHAADRVVVSDEQAREVARRSFSGWVATWAICEAVAVLGFAASMISMQPTVHFWPFAAVSLLLFVIHRPRGEWIEEVVRAQTASPV